MLVFLVSDDEVIATTVRQILSREGLECPPTQVLSTYEAARQLAKSPADLVVAVLPNEPSQSGQLLDILAEIPRVDSSSVIGIGPSTDPKLVIRALRGIVNDYVYVDDLEPELLTALANWRARQPVNDNEARLIAVLGPSGGSGSSTVASNVATVLAKEHKTVALFDLRFESGDLASLLNLKPTYTLADLSQNVNRMDRVFFEKALVRHASGVHLLASPRQFADASLISTEGIRQAIAMGRNLFPYVVADMDRSFREEHVQVLQQADIAMLVMRLDFASLMNARRVLEQMEYVGVPRDRIRLVVNRHGQPCEVPASKAEDALGFKVFHYLPDEPKTINRANNNGVPVVLESPSSKVARSVTKLAISVNGRHHEH